MASRLVAKAAGRAKKNIQAAIVSAKTVSAVERLARKW
jgi:hypothetical protein